MPGWTKDVLTEAITEDANERMRKGARFVSFPDEGTILGDSEYDEWVRENGLLSLERRYAFLPFADRRGRTGYAVNAVGEGRAASTTLTIPTERVGATAEETLANAVADLWTDDAGA